MKRIAFYGGSFDPLHNGHLTIARALTDVFRLDEFVFIPAFHAPHKKDKKPTSAFHRFAMIACATNDERQIEVSKMELDVPERPYTIETLTRLKNELTDAEIFFVMGADSWADITTWREWEKVLMLVNIIVVTRPDYKIGFGHVTDEIRERIVDLRNSGQWSAAQSRGGQLKSEIRNPKSLLPMPCRLMFRRPKFGRKSRQKAVIGRRMCRRRLQNISKSTNFTFNIYHLSFTINHSMFIDDLSFAVISR